MASMTIDTEQVRGIAQSIENDNAQLQSLLNDSKATIDNLASVWTTTDGKATIDSYNSFAGKYFQVYFDVLDQYVKFLRANVAESYDQVVTINTQISDMFK